MHEIVIVPPNTEKMRARMEKTENTVKRSRIWANNNGISAPPPAKTNNRNNDSSCLTS